MPNTRIKPETTQATVAKLRIDVETADRLRAVSKALGVPVSQLLRVSIDLTLVAGEKSVAEHSARLKDAP